MSVALLAEGVDRNKEINALFSNIRKSPSSRRAWIEIADIMQQRHDGDVALLAEGVDRNSRW